MSIINQPVGSTLMQVISPFISYNMDKCTPQHRKQTFSILLPSNSSLRFWGSSRLSRDWLKPQLEGFPRMSTLLGPRHAMGQGTLSKGYELDTIR